MATVSTPSERLSSVFLPQAAMDKQSTNTNAKLRNLRIFLSSEKLKIFKLNGGRSITPTAAININKNVLGFLNDSTPQM